MTRIVSTSGSAGGAGSSGSAGNTIKDEIDNSAVGSDIKNAEDDGGTQSVEGTFEHTAIDVMQGDCFVSLAAEHGYFWKTLWNHGDNYEVKKVRKNANVLMPGDTIRVPVRTEKQESGATEARHTFKLKNPPSVLRIKVLLIWEAFASEPYKLWLNEEDPPIEGTTDGNGVIEEEIPPETVWAKLEVGSELELYEYVL